MTDIQIILQDVLDRNVRLQSLLNRARNYHISTWSIEEHRTKFLMKLLDDIDTEIGPYIWTEYE